MAKTLYPAKEETKQEQMVNWVDRHSALIIIFCFVALSFLFAVLINVVYGMCMMEHVVNVKWA